MQDARFERLVGCFEKVFPHLDRNEIPTASLEGVGTWDSIAHVTLLSVVGEEFGIGIDFEEFEGATSFAAIHDLLRVKSADA